MAVKTASTDSPDFSAICWGVRDAAGTLTEALRGAGHLAEALQLGQQTSDEWFAKFEAFGDDFDRCMTSIGVICDIHTDMNKQAIALPLLVKLLSDRRRVQGDTDERTLVTMRDLANCYTGLGDCSSALPLLEEAIAAGAKNPELALSRAALAALYLLRGIPSKSFKLAFLAWGYIYDLGYVE